MGLNFFCEQPECTNEPDFICSCKISICKDHLANHLKSSSSDHQISPFFLDLSPSEIAEIKTIDTISTIMKKEIQLRNQAIQSCMREIEDIDKQCSVKLNLLQKLALNLEFIGKKKSVPCLSSEDFMFQLSKLKKSEQFSKDNIEEIIRKTLDLPENLKSKLPDLEEETATQNTENNAKYPEKSIQNLDSIAGHVSVLHEYLRSKHEHLMHHYNKDQSLPAKKISIIEFENRLVYKGELNENNEFHGFGTCTWSNGAKYEGYWENSKKHGVGRFINSSGVYEGQYKDDRRHGIGKYAASDGSSYIQHFQEGRKTDLGILFFPNQDQFAGSFFNDTFSGTGAWQYSNGDSFIGEFVDGKKEGFGIYQWASGIIYKGEFLNGNQHGKGWFIDSEGTKIENIKDIA